MGFWFALDLFRLIGFIVVDFMLLRLVGFKLVGFRFGGFWLCFWWTSGGPWCASCGLLASGVACCVHLVCFW